MVQTIAAFLSLLLPLLSFIFSTKVQNPVSLPALSDLSALLGIRFSAEVELPTGNLLAVRLLLSGIICMVLMRRMRQDYRRYSSYDTEDEREEFGWKLI